MARGAAWMVLARLADRVIGVASTLVLARVLVPHDFGIVAMAMSFVALLELTTAFGFEAALVQKQEQTRARLDTAWTFSILFGLVVSGAMVACAGPIAAFFREPDLQDVMRALALGFLVQGFQNVGIVAFRIEMRFDREFRFMLAKKLVGFVVTVPLALLLQSFWALVIGQIASRVGGTLLSYLMHPYRPRVSLAASGELFGFSKWILALSWIGYVIERSPEWVLGRLLGPGAVGVFSLAAEFARLPSTEISAPVNRAVFSGYSRLKDDASALRREYVSVLAMVSLLAVPAALGLGAVAELFVPAVLGERWVAAVPVLKLMCAFGLMTVLQSNASALFLAVGRSDLTARLLGAQAVLLVALMIVLSQRMGVAGAALAYVLSLCVVLPATFVFIARATGLRLREIVAAIWRPVLAAGVMFLAVQRVCERLGTSGDTGELLLKLVVAAASGAVVYALVIAAAWFVARRPEGAEAMLLRRVPVERVRRVLLGRA